MEDSGNSSELNSVFIPELLSQEDLVHILKKRYVPKDLNKLSKEVLVDIFYKVALPLPQRLYSEDLCRGKYLNAKRKLEEEKKKKDSPSPSKKGDHLSVKSNGLSAVYRTVLSKSNEKSSSPPKPLPDQINYTRKKIKLHGITSSSSELDKIVIINKKSKCDDTSANSSTSKKGGKREHEKDNENESGIRKDSSPVKKSKRPIITWSEEECSRSRK